LAKVRAALAGQVDENVREGLPAKGGKRAAAGQGTRQGPTVGGGSGAKSGDKTTTEGDGVGVNRGQAGERVRGSPRGGAPGRVWVGEVLQGCVRAAWDALGAVPDQALVATPDHRRGVWAVAVGALLGGLSAEVRAFIESAVEDLVERPEAEQAVAETLAMEAQ